MKSISVQSLHEALQNLPAGSLILDVRTPGEFADGRVPGAKNIPVDQLPSRASELTSFQMIYIYCRSGGRAGVAAQILQTLGNFNMEIVDEGGFPDWKAFGFDFER
jgi:rhodanese-related sulfurtransferase